MGNDLHENKRLIYMTDKTEWKCKQTDMAFRKESVMTGKLYGVGVGPGDPELVTLKALRLTKEADILAFPGENPKESVAYKIMKGAYPEIDSKQMISLPMPMIK